MNSNYIFTLTLLATILLSSCSSFDDTVKANKEKFIQVGIENSQPVGLDNLESLYSAAQAKNTEAKIKALNIENLETLYQDSVVLFVHGSELAVYDFSSSEQKMSTIKNKLQMFSIEKIDNRLFYGKR